MGLVVDELLARRSICTCHAIGETDRPEDLICFTAGVIGTLNNRQDVEFCRNKVIIRDNGIRERVERFRDASEICEIETERFPKGEKLIPRLRCMARELRKRGIEI